MSIYFLSRFAQRLVEEFPDDLSRVTVVLPTSRARLFLLRHLHALKGSAFWAPRCMILPEWVRSVSPGRVGGELEMIAAMFEQYRDTVGGSDSFEVFLGWQSVARRDFNDVDAALAPAKHVFSDLKNIRQIEGWQVEAWSFNREHLSKTQEDFLRFWLQLGELYAAFTKWQDEHACWTYTRAVRFLAEHPEQIQLGKETDTIFFVGLGNYSEAERKLIKHVSLEVHVEEVWDVDRYYFDNKQHEAGSPARSRMEVVKKGYIGDQLANRPMRAHVIECSTSISQVIYAADVLTKLTTEELEKTCVVVNDETALEPLLSAIADVRGEVNLAIGKPLQQTQLSRLAEELFVVRSLHLRKGRIYYKPFVNWIQTILATGFERSACELIREEIVRLNIAQITPAHLVQWSEKFPTLKNVLQALSTEVSAAEAVGIVLEFIQAFEPDDDFMRVTRHKMIGVLEELQSLLLHSDYMNKDDLLLKLYQLVIGRMKLYFEGEPVSGLQVLSLSETRALDFDRVLFLGANEDYFPGERFEQSFIPFDLRAFYKLTMPEHIDAVHAYTYYRLLHHAQEVYYFYSAIIAETKPGERSRYITQLLSELKQANSAIEIIEEVVGTEEVVNFREGVASSDFIRSRIKTLFASGLSPSAINKLISCPLDFYYLYVARLGEEKEVEESLSSSKFGEIVHKVLENFYKPYLNSFPEEAAFLQLRSRLEPIVLDSARDLYHGRNLDKGIDYLSVRIAVEMLEKYIDSELEAIRAIGDTTFNRRVVLVEKEATIDFPEGKGGLPIPFKLKGKIDRGDSVAGVLHLIDYKTGKVTSGRSKFSGDFDALFTNKDYSKFLQLLIYIMMMRKRNEPIPMASFYSMREGGGSFVNVQDLSELPIDHDFLDKAEEALCRFLHELLERPSFYHNTKARYCEYCFIKS